jgi:hypothetical protein
MCKTKSGALRAFFSNGGYATWIQTVVVAVSVGVAVLAIRETDTNQSIANSSLLAQKYFSEKPTLASGSLHLRIAQFVQVQEAKKPSLITTRGKIPTSLGCLRGLDPWSAKKSWIAPIFKPIIRT